MVFDPTNTNQVRTWIKDAPPEELLTIAPVLFNRIGTLGQNSSGEVRQGHPG